MKNKVIRTGVAQRASGKVKILIVENGKVVRELPWQKNLILNQGLDNVCSSFVWADNFLYCAAGSGTTATSATSGAGVTATGTTGTFTNDTPGSFDFTTNSSVGDMIQMTSGVDTGVEVRITSVTDANNVVYTPANSIASGEFTVWKTSQTGLTTELKRTNTYLTGSGNCDSTFSSPSVVLRRTFDFTAEVGAVTYNEVGFSQSVTVAANLFSRIKLASGVALVAGQALRVVYALTITFSPITPDAQTFSITGWPVAPALTTDGDQQIIRPGIAGVETAGATTFAGSGWDGTSSGTGLRTLEPSKAVSQFGIAGWISPSSDVIEAFAGTGTPTDRRTNASMNNVTLSSYTALNFFRDKIVVFAVGDANRTDFRSMGLGSRIGGSVSTEAAGAGNAFVCLFDEAQTKDSLHTLTLNFRITVGRVLA